MKPIAVMILTILLILTGLSYATTYYVSKTGSDTNNGRSWAAAWRTENYTNGHIAAGDTVRFGTGKWFNTRLHPPTGGTFNTRTVYACSTFSPATWHNSIMSGGDSVTTWTVYSGNIWQATKSGSDCQGDGTIATLSQNDSLMINMSSLGGVNAQGRFYHNGTTIYAWLFGNGNPNTKEMIASCHEVVGLNHDSQKHILFYGLDFRMGKQGVIFFCDNAGYETTRCDVK